MQDPKGCASGDAAETELKKVRSHEWRRRLREKYEHEPRSLDLLDDVYGHGAQDAGEKARIAAMYDALKRARDAGASDGFVKKLSELILDKYPHIFRINLGADSAARVEPMKINFDGDKFPARVSPRRYSPPQQKFLREQIPELVRIGILRPSRTRFCAPPFLPTKSDGTYRLCVDSRSQNRCTEASSSASHRLR